MSINIHPAVKSFGRSAWKPIVENGDGPLSASKFAGLAFVKPDEEYPLCQNCGKPLQLFVQLDLDTLPEQLREEFGRGLLQLFYCVSEKPLCEVECSAFFPFAKSVVTRIIPPETTATAVERPSFEGAFPPKLIIGWEEMEDFPGGDEAESLGIELDEDEMDALCESGYPLAGDKLAGYPMWVQGIEYPDCPVCGEEMRLLFQIDSEDNLPFMFGDIGCGHITQCKTHREQVAFGWACS